MNRIREINLDKIEQGKTYSPKELCELTGVRYYANTSQNMNAFARYMDLEKVGRGRYLVREIYDCRIPAAGSSKAGVGKAGIQDDRETGRDYHDLFRRGGTYIRAISNILVYECLNSSDGEIVLRTDALPGFLGMTKPGFYEEGFDVSLIDYPELYGFPYYVRWVCNSIINDSLYGGVPYGHTAVFQGYFRGRL